MTKTNTDRTRSLIAIAAAVVLLPGLLAACSSNAPDTVDTKAPGSKGATTASCMRDKGYEMDDPTAGGAGGTAFSVPEGVDKDQYMADLQKCMGSESSSGAAGSGESGSGGAKSLPGGEKMAKEAAKCIREHGFEDYPDDMEAAGGYEPDDEDAFADVSKQCNDEAFGTSGSVAQ